MMKRISLILISIIAGPLWAEEPVLFADAKLKAVVEEALFIVDPTPSDMLGLTALEFTGTSFNPKPDDVIHSLAGLEYALNLRSLSLRLNRIEDMSPLAGLTNLRYLDLSQNDRIKELSPVTGLTQLRHLDVHGNSIRDISSVSGLTQLDTLNLRWNSIHSIEPIADLSGLEHLDLRGNNIMDVSVLAGLQNLKDLNLHDNRISDITDLLALRNLNTLIVTWNILNEKAYTDDLYAFAEHNPGMTLNYDPNPRAPEGILATDGAFSDAIHVRWQEVPNGPNYTTYYRIYRAIKGDEAGGPITEWRDFLLYNDTAVQPGVEYDYWVQAAVSETGDDAGNYSETDTGWASGGLSLSLSSSIGGSVIAPGEETFIYPEDQIVTLSAESQDPSLFSFSHWTGTAVEAGRVTDPYLASTTVSMDADYRVRAQFVSLLDTLYVDDDAAGHLIQDGSIAHPLSQIGSALEVASDETVIQVAPGTYEEVLSLGDKAIQLIGFSPEGSSLEPYPVIDGNDQGPVITFSGGAACILSGFVLTGGFGKQAGGVACMGSSPMIEHCLMVGNRFTDPNGGAVYLQDSHSVFVNCTIADNVGLNGGAGITLMDSDATIRDSILWNNVPVEIVSLGVSFPNITYSTITGGWPGTGNLSDNPMFAAPGRWVDETDFNVPLDSTDPTAVFLSGDYHLRSEAGRYSAINGTWELDNGTSSAVDAGDPESDWSEEPLPNGARINQGAYGGTSQASKSP